MTFGLTPQGWNPPRLADIKQFMENAFIAQFGEVNVAPQSVFGQEIGVLSKMFADLWENLDDLYFSQYPNSASGVALDNVVQLNGITRLPAQQTSVVATCTGLEGTFIPPNSLASILSTGQTFYTPQGGSITAGNADAVTITINALAAQPYTTVLSGNAFTYSLPIITFSHAGAIFVTSNSIVVVINGVELAPVPFNSTSDQTLMDIASAISAFDATNTCVATAVTPATINIVPKPGKSVMIQTPIQITGGAYSASSALTYAVPSTFNAVTAALVALINVGTPTWAATDGMDHTLTVTANNPSVPFSCAVGIAMSITNRASPITFLSEDYGPVACPINTLTNIVTPIAGWNAINNTVAGVLGRFIETDTELRLRRANSIRLLGSGTVQAIEAGLTQKVSGVTSATVFENVTLTELPVVITFPAPFNSSDSVIIVNNVNTITQAWDTDQATTMADIVAQFELLPQVSSASYGGTGNQTITVNFNVNQILEVSSATTTNTLQTALITGGRPPKSFEAVVQGGSDLDVANQIWLTKPAGIETYGNVNGGSGIEIIDSQGNTQVIFFSRPVPVYIYVQVALTLYTEETFPVNGLQQVADNIAAYGNTLGVGIDVLFQRVQAQIFSVPGVASGAMLIAGTNLITDTPSYADDDIAISETQISVFDTSRIFVTLA